jgi:TetR/AcrR family transcriptional regulator
LQVRARSPLGGRAHGCSCPAGGATISATVAQGRPGWKDLFVADSGKVVGRPPGRPRQDGQESGRDRLIKVARREFGRRGYAATSVEELVSLADVSSPTMYHHFESKFGLFIAAAEDAYERTLTVFRSVVEPDASFEDAMNAIIDVGIVLMRDEADLAMMITTMQFELRRDPELARRLQPALLEFRAFFDDVAQRAPAELKTTPNAARDLSHLLIAMIAGLATESLLMSRHDDVANMFEALRLLVTPR